MPKRAGKIVDLPDLRNRARVFRDRSHAGRVLAEMLSAFRGTGALILAIPAGGVPVAVTVATELGLPLDLAVVSKITLPWNTEAGYGAVAFDGSVRLNRDMIVALGLGREIVDEGTAWARERVERRMRELRGDRPLPDVEPRDVILIDDGLASGFTLHAAVDALRRLRAGTVIVAVPTAHAESVARIAGIADALYSPNIRRGMSFAVADAYERWTDVDEATVVRVLQEFNRTFHV